MGLMAKDNGGGDFKLAPPGAHIAVCDMVVDIGLQPNNFYNKQPKHKVYLRWQLPHERLEFTKDNIQHNVPMSVGATLTVSLSKKAVLRGFLESWRGRPFTDEELKGFDLFTIIGVPCQVNIMHEVSGDKTYANVTAIMPLPKGMTKPVIEGKTIKYSPDDPGQLNDVPEWLRKKIAAAIKPEDLDDKVEQSRKDFSNGGGALDSDDIPFGSYDDRTV